MSSNLIALVGANVDKPYVFLRHGELLRTDGSLYRSVCPVCSVGHLMVQRDPKSFRIVRSDRCTLCGQGVIYTDAQLAGETLPPLPSDFAKRNSDIPS